MVEDDILEPMLLFDLLDFGASPEVVQNKRLAATLHGGLRYPHGY